jgi:hypothetical protein
MKVVLFANTDWYLWNFRRSLALTREARTALLQKRLADQHPDYLKTSRRLPARIQLGAFHPRAVRRAVCYNLTIVVGD